VRGEDFEKEGHHEAKIQPDKKRPSLIEKKCLRKGEVVGSVHREGKLDQALEGALGSLREDRSRRGAKGRSIKGRGGGGEKKEIT